MKFGQFITDIGIYDNDEAPECRHLFMLHGMILHDYSSLNIHNGIVVDIDHDKRVGCRSLKASADTVRP